MSNAGPSLRVVVVSEENDLVARVRRMLMDSTEGHAEIIAAATADEARGVHAWRNQDVVLVDVDSTPLGGVAMLAAMEPVVAVLGMSRDDSTDLEEQALRAGVDDLVDHTRLHADALMRIVRNAARIGARRRTIGSDLARLRQAQEDLDRFAIGIVHDIRQPLTTVEGVLGALQLRLADKVEPAVHALIERGVGASRRIDQLLADLLGRVEHPEQAPLRMPVELDELVADALDAVADHIPPEAELRIDDLGRVWSDANRVARIIDNVVANWLRHAVPATSDGVPPVLHVTAEWHEFGVTIAFDDNGPGIPEELRERVFSWGARAAGPEVDGSGIGLATCRSLAVAIGGRLWAAPSPLGGTSIQLELPVRLGDVTAPGHRGSRAHGAETRGTATLPELSDR